MKKIFGFLLMLISIFMFIGIAGQVIIFVMAFGDLDTSNPQAAGWITGRIIGFVLFGALAWFLFSKGEKLRGPGKVSESATADQG